MTVWLYRYEAKGIQSYVLSTQVLREMAGASQLVETLAADATRLLRAEARVVMAAAGGATLVFDSTPRLESFARHWPMFVDQTRPGLQLIQAWCECGGSPGAQEYELLRQRLDVARSAPLVDLPAAGPWVARAGRTGLPAIHDGEHGLEDWVTHEKAKAGKRELDFRDIVPRGKRLPYDIEALSTGYVAVIHADVNGVGQLLIEHGKELAPRMGEFADGLADATRTAARMALAALAERQPADARNLAARPVVLGGDDLTVIVDARYALGFALKFIEHLRVRTKERLGKIEVVRSVRPNGLDACAGLAFVRQSHPFHEAYALSEQLCQEAKALLNRRSGILFHRATASTVRTWDEIKRTELNAAPVGGAPRPGGLVGGPWSMPGDGAASADASSLAKLVAAVRRTPRGSLREWLTLARSSGRAAQARWDRVVQVLDPANREALAESLTLCNADPKTGFRDNGTTPIGDALTCLAVGIEEVVW